MWKSVGRAQSLLTALRVSEWEPVVCGGIHPAQVTISTTKIEATVCSETLLLIPSSSTGTTARCGLWPVEQYPSIFSYLSPTLSIFSVLPLIDFRNNNFFYCAGLLAPRQTPNLEDQGIPFCLGHHP
jgi:hypothetical protein